jgi:guanylate kinase
MSDTLYLFVGKSASGKTTVANFIEKKHGFKQVNSYTTRPSRYEGEIGHIFLSDEDFDELGEMVAYTEYNGFRYGTTAEQLDQCQIYVVDVPGVETLLQRYQTDRPITIIYFDTTVHTRINRMIDRGDSDMAIVSRLLQDEKDDWFKQLDQLVWHYAHIINKNVQLYSINADGNKEDVLESVLYSMKTACGGA